MDIEIEMHYKPKRNLKLLKKPLTSKRNDFAEFLDTELKEIKKEKPPAENLLLITNIENIYLNLKSPNPFRNMRSTIVFLLFISQTILWCILDQLGDVKSNYYCYDPHSTYFELCDMKTYCRDAEKGITSIYFLSSIKNQTINNKSTLEELNLVNKIFRDYYSKEYFQFSVENLDQVNKLKSFTNYYSTIVNINYAENWNMFLTFRQCCKRETDLLIFAIFILIGLTIGNIFFGFLADVFGRKTLLNFIISMQTIGCFGIFLFTIFVLNTGSVAVNNAKTNEFSQIDNYFNPNLTISGNNTGFNNYSVVNVNLTSNDILINYLNTNYLDDSLDYEYNQNFSEFEENHLENKTISENYKNYKIIFFFFFFLVSSGISSGHNIILSLLFETSTNDRLIYRSYSIFSLGYILSFFFHFVLISLVNSFHFILFILAILLIFGLFLFKKFSYESPRFHFEYFEYEKLTKTMLNVVSLDEVQQFLVHPDNCKVEQEIGKYLHIKNESILTKDIVSFLFFNLRYKLDSIKKKLLNSELFDVKRSDIIRNPLILIYLANYNKNFRNRGLLIFSLIANISLSISIIISNYSVIYISPRMDFYENYIFNRYPFYLTLIMISSLYFIILLLKFYGVKTILFLCFVMNFVFSIIYSYYLVELNDPEDLNNFYLTDKNILVGISTNKMRVILGVLTFFGFGLYFTMFFYLMKFTKTLYRCLFLGICHVVFDFIMIFAFLSAQFFEANMYHVTITSIFGIVITFLINGDMGYNIINDFRRIYIGEK